MSSFIFQHFSLVSSSPPPPFLVASPSPFHASHISLSFPKKKSSEGKPPNGTLPKGRREILLDYVKIVQPEFIELFVKRAPQQVVDAMRQTVTNMIGTLPSQFFAVTATTVAENLARLMYNVMLSGYMFKNAQYRLELQQSLEQVALPDVQDTKVERVANVGETSTGRVAILHLGITIRNC